MQQRPFVTSSGISPPSHILPRMFRVWLDSSFVISLRGDLGRSTDVAATTSPVATNRHRQSDLRRGDTTLFSEGVIAFAALKERLRWRGAATSFFGIGFDDGSMFLSRRQPRIYDAEAKKVAATDLPPGSYVKVTYRADGKLNWLEAVQVVEVVEEESPFKAVIKNSHR